MDHTDAVIARAAKVLPLAARDFRQAVERMSLAEVYATARRIREDFASIEKHRKPIAYAHDVTAALKEAGYEPERFRGYPALSFPGVEAESLIGEALRLGAEIARYSAREADAIFSATKVDLKLGVIWWKVDGYSDPLEAA